MSKTQDNTIHCLDHGFVKLHNIASMIPRREQEFDVSDIDPAKVARISLDNLLEDRKKSLDMELVEYLLKHEHSSPIEFTMVWLEFKLPIFVARQFMRHRTFAYNEVSGRYVTLPEEFYIPAVVGGKSKSVKQGQENNLEFDKQVDFQKALFDQCTNSYSLYKSALEDGVAPEHSRLFLHLNHYTHYVCKVDLHNLMHFLQLRMDAHAQIEARIYANAVYTLLCDQIPDTMELFDKYKLK